MGFRMLSLEFCNSFGVVCSKLLQFSSVVTVSGSDCPIMSFIQILGMGCLQIFQRTLMSFLIVIKFDNSSGMILLCLLQFFCMAPQDLVMSLGKFFMLDLESIKFFPDARASL